MHRSSRAPELSATLRMVSRWITTCSLLRLLEDVGDAPALLLRQRPRLDDAHAIANAAAVVLVVRLEMRATLDDLLVEGVRLLLAHQHDNCLRHAVADDH